MPTYDTMSHFTVHERTIHWTPAGQKEIILRSHEIDMADVSSIQSLWGGVVFYIKDRVLIVYPNGDAHMGFMQSHHGNRTFVCDGTGRVHDPLPILAQAHNRFPGARVARESSFYEEPKEPRELACKYRG